MVQPIKVAIFGGGCAGVATAFELSRPEHNNKYEITLYQQGWRLGGKGASGRRAPNQRIEEHGLHLWMGFYENAFRMMRECYEELGRDPETFRIATFEQAFKPDNFVGVTEQNGKGEWRDWTAFFPPAAGLPGDPLKKANPFSVPGYLARCALMLRTLITSVQDRIPEDGVDGADNLMTAVTSLAKSTIGGIAADPTGTIQRAMSYGQLALGVAMAEALDILRNIFERPEMWRNQDGEAKAHGVLDQMSRMVHGQIERQAVKDEEVRRVWEIADIVLAIIRGILRDGLVTDSRGFDAIDHMDWSDWLEKHGASKAALEAGFIRGSYDLLFAYKDGDPTQRSLAAGQALRGALRMFFTYRGALFWKMQAGMGDIVFAPFYEVLEGRGVTFKFFHRLEDMKLDESGAVIQEINVTEQARVRGNVPYKPLVDVRGVPSWPAEPDYDQLISGAQLKKSGWDAESRWGIQKGKQRTLLYGEDYDLAVLATGFGEVPIVADELIAARASWQDMVRHVRTVATQAFQVWMDEPVDKLGWELPPINISGYVDPFDTWADMRQLLPVEDWETDPKAIAYFCSVLPDADIPTGADPRTGASAQVRDNAIAFLNNHSGHFWPHAINERGFRFDILSAELEDGDATELKGVDRFEEQFWTANINPTDRYVLSLPGTLKYRVSPLERSFDNLTIAGDWTACGHMAGCVEAAVMSGRLAAHAVSLQPPLEEIIGYDHP